jgi:hypothetical protein
VSGSSTTRCAPPISGSAQARPPWRRANFRDEGEPHPGPRSVVTVLEPSEGLEDLIEAGRRDAGPLVEDRDPDTPVLADERHRHRTVRRVLGRVGEQVVEHALDLGRVDVDHQTVGRNERDTLRGRRALDGVPHQGDQVGGPTGRGELAAAHPVEVAQLVAGRPLGADRRLELVGGLGGTSILLDMRGHVTAGGVDQAPVRAEGR